MPINEKLMSSLKSQHGAKKGKKIYYAMEAEGKVSMGKSKAKKKKGKK